MNTYRDDDVAARLYIGCAGWNIPSASAASFAQDGTHLERYATVFSGAEINSSFYRSHRPATYARWRDSVPGAFRFSVKMPRELSHVRRLRDTTEPLQRFLDEVSHLKEKLGCLLLQLPPSLAFVPSDANRFLLELRERFDGPVACEPRHPSWGSEQARALLQTWAVARVTADPEPVPSHRSTSGDIAYFRLHGSPDMYASSYPDAFLSSLAGLISDELPAKRAVWCVFDNTMYGAAVPNALALRALLSQASRTNT